VTKHPAAAVDLTLSVGNVNNAETAAEIVGLKMFDDRRARFSKRESC
jgi:hypothetical protein